MLPSITFLCETVYKFISNKIVPCRVVKHASETFEIQVPYKSNWCGKTFWICCPSISPFEWHPFTSVISKNQTNVSFFIKIRGDWTLKLANSLGISCNTTFHCTFPNLLINGPYHAIPKHTTMFETILHNTCVVVVAGIGITTFANLFCDLLVSKKQYNNIHIVFVCKKLDDISFFIEEILQLDKITNVHVFTTSGQYNVSVPIQVHYGRPCFKSLFEEIIVKYPFNNSDKHQIKVFFSGRTQIAHSIQNHIKKHIHFEFIPLV